jgi:hypothetical protein
LKKGKGTNMTVRYTSEIKRIASQDGSPGISEQDFRLCQKNPQACSRPGERPLDFGKTSPMEWVGAAKNYQVKISNNYFEPPTEIFGISLGNVIAITSLVVALPFYRFCQSGQNQDLASGFVFYPLVFLAIKGLRFLDQKLVFGDSGEKNISEKEVMERRFFTPVTIASLAVFSLGLPLAMGSLMPHIALGFMWSLSIWFLGSQVYVCFRDGRRKATIEGHNYSRLPRKEEVYSNL